MLKGIIVIYLIIKEVYNFILNKIRNDYRKNPLPKEVADIYDDKRYQQFLNYKKEYQSLSYKSGFIMALFELFIIFSPFFQWMDYLNNVYLILFVTITITSVVSWIVSYFEDYYATFTIEEKYGMNKKTYSVFLKDFIMEQLMDYVMELVLYGVIVFICEHLSSWTNHFAISYLKSFLFGLVIVVLLIVVVLALSMLSLLVMMKEYTFTDLEDQELLDNIHRMMEGCKKKIKGIKVYDESKKSTTKNAFVLGIPFYRIIGIADNFLNENSMRQLNGVLAHEIGHLKHKKNFWNFLKYSILILLFLCIVIAIPNGASIGKIANWINVQFGITHSHYYVYFLVLGILFDPLLYVYTLYSNYVTRLEEYEADQNAVKEGYGQDLIDLFKELSRDELVDVNPSPIIEFIEYDHPGMYQRILGLEKKL